MRGGPQSPGVPQHLKLASAELPPLLCPKDEGEGTPSETADWGMFARQELCPSDTGQPRVACRETQAQLLLP